MAGDASMLRRSFAKKGVALAKELRIRHHEDAYLIGKVQRLSRLRGLTPQERAGVRLALGLLTGKHTNAEIRRAVERRRG